MLSHVFAGTQSDWRICLNEWMEAQYGYTLRGCTLVDMLLDGSKLMMPPSLSHDDAAVHTSLYFLHACTEWNAMIDMFHTVCVCVEQVRTLNGFGSCS